MMVGRASLDRLCLSGQLYTFPIPSAFVANLVFHRVENVCLVVFLRRLCLSKQLVRCNSSTLGMQKPRHL